MIVALISAFFLVALGLAAKGVIVQALVFFGAWLTKNILLLGFFQTSTGKRTARAIKSGTYANLDGKGRRVAYRLFGFIGRSERATLTMAKKIVGEPYVVPRPPVERVSRPPLPPKDVPVEDLVSGLWRLGKRGIGGITGIGRALKAKSRT